VRRRTPALFVEDGALTRERFRITPQYFVANDSGQGARFSSMLIWPSFACDCDFDGAFRRIDWRDFDYSHRLVLIAVPIAPSVSAFRLEMTDKIENFNGPFPCSLILENFFHRNGFDVERFATMRRSNGVFEFRNLSRWHSSISLSAMSSPLIKSGICGMKFSKIRALTGCSDPMEAASI
jgi:hypothetical protein